MWKEVIGIISTIFILISMCINTVSWKGDVLMRVINLIGSIGFTAYGFILSAYSTGILNALLIIVNSYHLIKLLKMKNHYTNNDESESVQNNAEVNEKPEN